MPTVVLTLRPLGGSPASDKVTAMVRDLLCESASAEWTRAGAKVSGVGATPPIL